MIQSSIDVAFFDLTDKVWASLTKVLTWPRWLRRLSIFLFPVFWPAWLLLLMSWIAIFTVSFFVIFVIALLFWVMDLISTNLKTFWSA